MLVDPPIAIVGLSNWVLDPAKMNRAILMQSPEPSNLDISLTGASILGIEYKTHNAGGVKNKSVNTTVNKNKNPHNNEVGKVQVPENSQLMQTLEGRES